MSDYYDINTGEEVSDSTAHDMFDAYLDEVLDEVRIGTLTYSASRVLKEVDPIAYRCEFSDWTSEYLAESGYWVRVLTEDGELFDGTEPEWFADEDDARSDFDARADTLGDPSMEPGGPVAVQLYDTSGDILAEVRIGG